MRSRTTRKLSIFGAAVGVLAMLFGISQPASATEVGPGPSTAGYVSANFTTASSSLVTPALSTSVPATLVLTVSADGPEFSTQQVSSVTGCGLTWNTNYGQANGYAGVATIATATSTSGLKGCQVTAALLYAAQGQVTLTAYSNGQVGRYIAVSNEGSVSAGLDLPDSAIAKLVAHDWDSEVTPTPSTGSFVDALFLSDTGDTSWTQYSSPQSAGTFWIGATMNPGDDINALVYDVELVA